MKNMKLFFLAFFLLSVSCSVEIESKKIDSKEIDTKCKVELIWKSGSSEISIVTIDNCEYILYDDSDNSNMIHKANCKNCSSKPAEKE